MPDKFIIREYRENDLNALAQLHHTVYSSERSIEQTKAIFQWKMCYCAGVSIFRVAECNGSIVCAFGGIPIKFKLRGSIIELPFIVTSMVHPNHCGKYLFHKTVKVFQEIFVSEKESLSIGFPNDIAAKIQMRYFSGQTLFHLKRYAKPLTFYALVYKKQRNFILKLFLYFLSYPLTPIISLNKWVDEKPSHCLKINKLNDIPSDYEAFWEETSKKYEITEVRDREYLEWRFFDEPNNNNEFYEARIDNKLVGYFVLNFQNHNADVVDFFCIRKEKIVSSVFCSMGKLILKRRSWNIRIFIHDDIVEDIIVRAKFNVDSQTIFGISKNNARTDGLAESLARPQSWYLTGALYSIG